MTDRVIAIHALMLAAMTGCGAAARGSSLDDTRAAIGLDAAQAALCKGDPWCQNGFAGVFVAPAVARAYREAKDGPLHDED